MSIGESDMELIEVGKLMVRLGGTEAIKKLVGTVIETHIKPMLQKHADYADNSEYLQECLEEYLEISYSKAMVMNTIVFRGIPKTVYDLYIPLCLIIDNSMQNVESEEYVIDDSYLSCIEKYNKILIVDTAGMGKSTLVKFLAIQAINHNDYIPIIIELRKVDKTKEILDYILEQFQLLDKGIDKNDFTKMLRRGEFIIFFDGYDEITNENRGGILDNIQKFIKKSGNNKYILTSRDENDLNCLGDFQRFSIKPLSIEEAFSLIKRYDNNGEKSEKLINRIKNDQQLDMLREFLVNPMLTSLLYKTFEYKEEISYKKLGFYSQVYEALFNDHDKTKGGAYVHPKKSKLDNLDFEKLLRRIAFISLKNNQVEYSKSAFANIIDKCKKDMSWVFTSTIDVLDDLTHAVPLFQKDGNDYKWIHKSFMEYFAAGFICYDSEKTEHIFKSMINSEKIERYKNVLDFCYDMKPDVARKIWVYPYICNFIKEYEGKYSAEIYYGYRPDIVDLRKSVAFTHEMVLIHCATEEEAENAFRSKYNFNKISSCINGCAINTITLFHETSDMIAHGKKNNYYIQELLLYKGFDIFQRMQIGETHEKELFIKCGEYILNDDARLKINKDRESFEYIAELIKRLFSGGSYLDYKKCKLLKEQMESEIREKEEIESEFDFF